jgi:DNA gyrase subunit A
LRRETGLVAGVKVVDDDDDVIIITDDGVIIRISVEEITKQSRYGRGVRTMRVAEESSVVTLARAPKEEEGDGEDADEETDGAEGAPEAPEAEETQE